MTSTNREIVEKYYEFMNAQEYDRMAELASEKGVWHGADYVGLGIMIDPNSKAQAVIKQVFEGGPSVGVLEVGDVIVRAKLEDRILESVDDLTNPSWGQGKFGGLIEVTIQRNGETRVFPITRGRVPAPEFPIQEGLKEMGNNVKDIQAKILMTVVEGDKVAVYDTGSYYDKTYNVTVVTTSCSIFRLENGKITDIWSMDDNSSYMRQVGYQIIPPVKEKA